MGLKGKAWLDIKLPRILPGSFVACCHHHEAESHAQGLTEGYTSTMAIHNPLNETPMRLEHESEFVYRC